MISQCLVFGNLWEVRPQYLLQLRKTYDSGHTRKIVDEQARVGECSEYFETETRKYRKIE